MSSILPPKPDRRKPDFTLTMINIVFLLLLFFLTTGSLTNRNEAQADTPITKDLPLERLPRPLLLLTREHEFYLDGVRVERPALVASARRAIENAHVADAQLNMLGQRDMPAADFLDVAEELRGAGIPVQVVTLHGALKVAGAKP